MMKIRECDWKVLRRLKPLALGRFCERTLDECVRVATGDGVSAHERYRALYKLIEDRDRELAAVFDDFRRATAITCVMAMVSRGLLTEAEFAEFSEETRHLMRELVGGGIRYAEPD